MLCYTSLTDLLAIPLPFSLSILLCSFVLSQSKPHRKQWREAANREQIDIHRFLMNFCSWV